MQSKGMLLTALFPVIAEPILIRLVELHPTVGLTRKDFSRYYFKKLASAIPPKLSIVDCWVKGFSFLSGVVLMLCRFLE